MHSSYPASYRIGKNENEEDDSNFIIASLFVQNDSFTDAVDLNTEPSGLNHRNKGRGFKQNSVHIHLQPLVSESYSDGHHVYKAF